MSVERSLNVKVNTIGDPSGAKEVSSAFGQLTDKTTEAWKEGGKLEGAHRKLHEIMREIGENTAPELGRGLFTALEGPVGIIITLLSAFTALRESIAETNKQLDETADKTAEGYGNLGESIANVTRQIHFARDAMTQYLDDAKKGEDELKTKIEARLDVIHRVQEAQIALTDAVEAEQLAAIHAEEKLGAIDHVTALRLEARVKDQAEQRKNAAADAAAQSAVTEKGGQLSQATLDQHNLQIAVDALGKGEIHRKAEVDNADKVSDHLNRDLTDAKAEVTKALETVEQKKKDSEFIQPDDRQVFEDTEMQPARDKLREAEAAQARIQQALDGVANTKARYELEQKNYEQAKTQLQEITKTVAELTTEVTKLKDKARDDANLRNTITGIHRDTGLIEQIPDAVQAAGNAALNGASSQATRIVGTLDSIIGIHRTIATALDSTHSTLVSQQSQLDDLASKIARVDDHSKARDQDQQLWIQGH